MRPGNLLFVPLLFGILYLPLSVFAQKAVFTLDENLKGKVHTAFLKSEDRKGGFLFLTDSKKVRLYRLDNGLKIQGKLSYSRAEQDCEGSSVRILGTHKIGKRYAVFAKLSGKRNGYRMFFFEQDMKFLRYEKIDISARERLLSTAKVSGGFAFVTMPTRNNEINVFLKNGEKNLSTQNYRFEDSFPFRTAVRRQSGYYIGKVPEDFPSGLIYTFEKAKLYAEGKKLIFTLDDEEATRIAEITPGEKKVTYKTVSAKGNFKGRNSYLSGDTLWTLSHTSKSISLSAQSLSNDKILFGIEGMSGAENFDFANTPLIQEGSAINPFARKILPGTDAFIKKMSGSSPALAVRPLPEGRLLVSVGAQKRYPSNGGTVAAPYMPGGFMATPYNGFSVSGILSGLLVWRKKEERFREIFFETVLNTKGKISHEMIKTEVQDAEKIASYRRSLSVKNGVCVFELNGDSFMSFYYEEGQRFVIMKF